MKSLFIFLTKMTKFSLSKANNLNSSFKRTKLSPKQTILQQLQNCKVCGVKCSWGFPYKRDCYCHLHNPMNKVHSVRSSLQLNLVNIKPLFFDDKGNRDIRREAEYNVSQMTKKQKKRFIKEYEERMKEIRNL